MSTLAVIQVIQCDRCLRIITLDTEEKYDNYEQTWLCDSVFDICPNCRVAPLTSEEEKVDIELMEIF